MGGGGGGSQTVKNEVKLPKWLDAASRENIARAEQAAQIGYVPEYLPQVAAMAPAQEAAMMNTNNMAEAFGLQGGVGSYLPEAQTYANGVQGYGTWDLAQEGINRLQSDRPGQYDAITRMFMNPFTGEGAPETVSRTQMADLQDKIDRLLKMNRTSADRSRHERKYN